MLAGHGLQVGILGDHRLGDDKLTDKIDESVELGRINPDQAGGASTGTRCNGRWERGRFGHNVRSRPWRDRGGRRDRDGLGCDCRSRRNGDGWCCGRRGGGRLLRCRQQATHVLDHRRHRQADLLANTRALDLCGHLVDESLEDVGPGKDRVDRPAVESVRAATGGVEQRFQLVGEPLDDGQLHHAGIALERVKGAKHGCQRIFVLRPLLEHEHALLDVLQQILRFRAEEPHEFAIGVIRENGEEFRDSRRMGLRGRGCRSHRCPFGLAADGLAADGLAADGL